MKFLSCFQDPYAANSEQAGSCLLPNGKKQGCAFCNVTRDNGFYVVWEDEELIAFRDRYVLCLPARWGFSLHMG